MRASVALGFVILVTLVNLIKCRQYQSLESLTRKWDSLEATMRVKEQEINQLRVKVQKQKMELHRANIEIDYLLQARDALIEKENKGRLRSGEETLQTLCFRPGTKSDATHIIARFPAMTADQLIFVNTNCKNTEADNNGDPLLLLCDGKQQIYSTESQCQCPTKDQLLFVTKSELAKTNIQLELSNGKMICTNFSQNNVETVTRLLIPQDETGDKFDTYRTTLLLLCRFYSRNNLIDLVQKLIKNNPTAVTETTAAGSNALLVLSAFSSSKKIVQVAQLLIENGVSVNEKGKYGYNALMALFEYSTSDKMDKVAELLIKKGIHLEEVDESDKNALSVLCAFSKNIKILRVVELLINNGMIIRQKDKNGKTAADYMNERSLHEVPSKSQILDLIEKIKTV